MLIPDPKFYLKEKTAKEPTLIYLQAKYTHNTHGGQRVMLSAGDKIHPNEWDDLKQRAIVTKKTIANADINIWLDKMSNTFKSIFRNFLIDDIVPTDKMVKEKLEEVLQLKNIEQAKQVKVITLYSFIASFIEESKSQKAFNTVKSYKSTFVRLTDYGTYSNKEFSFSDITLEWRAGFIKFLQSLGAGRNTEGKHIKNIKVFLNEATERGINANLSFKSKSFSKPGENVEKIFLTTDEIKKLYDLDLSDDQTQDLIRDYFIIACSTSLRYSDFIRIKKEHVKGDCIQMVTTKTNQEVIIPISPMVKSVFEKYDFNLPKAPCNQIFNRQLKEIGKQAGLDEKIHITKTIGGIKKDIVEPKWKFLTSHVGRRSLVSNCILEGINTSSIMLISGHKSLKAFQGYVRVNQHQNAQALKDHSFFK